jgi:hypothetical protein
MPGAKEIEACASPAAALPMIGSLGTVRGVSFRYDS